MLQEIASLFNAYLVPLIWKIMGAIALWIIGGWLIGFAGKLLARSLAVRKIDATLTRYLESGANVLMRLLLIAAVFGVLGVETTSFAALLAAAGIAVGVAWGGLLTHFAAGVFLIVLRPFKVGDFVTAGGVTGEVKGIGLFVTTIDMADNVRVYVGNNKIFSDSIQNYAANPYRRVDLTTQIAPSVNPADAIKRLQARVAQIPNVLTDPAPSVEILQFNQSGTLIAVRPFCYNDDYWQVYFDGNKAIAEVSSEAGYEAPA